MQWQIAALALAYKTAPRTLWQPQPVYDHDAQLYSLATMRAQFAEMADRARARIMSAPGQWATTGRWPRLRNAPAFFLREALLAARDRSASAEMPGNKAVDFHAPPWSADEAAWLEAETVTAWYSRAVGQWVESQARHWFRFQEDFHNSMYPRE